MSQDPLPSPLPPPPLLPPSLFVVRTVVCIFLPAAPLPSPPSALYTVTAAPSQRP
jgi:hypothetical protein